MKTINYESDFKLKVGYSDGSPISEPFRFTFYTKVSRGTFIAEYNGSEYVNCYHDGGMVKIPFDKPMLGMGVLSVKIELFINDSDFADGKYDYVSEERTGIILDKGATEPFEDMELLISKPNTRGIEMFLSKPYLGEGGGGGEIPNGSITEAKLANDSVSTAKIKEGAVTENKLSEEVREKLNKEVSGYEPPVGGIPKTDLSEEVQASLDKADTALQEDSLTSYAKLSEVEKIAEGLVKKDAYTSDIQGLQEDIEELASTMITAEPAEGDSEEVEDYVLMASDVMQTIGDSDKPISQAAVKSAINSIEEMIVSVINTPI